MSDTEARPGFPGVSVVEALVIFTVLLALQFAYAASGFAVGLSTIAHRICYIIATATACTWTLRLHEGFSLRYMGVTVVLVAAGIVSIVLFATVDPTIVIVASLTLAALFGVVLRFTDALPNWTDTHTTLLLVVLGTTAMFVATAPRAPAGGESITSVGFDVTVTPVLDGLASQMTFAREGVSSAVDLPLAAVGAGLYVLGRLLE